MFGMKKIDRPLAPLPFGLKRSIREQIFKTGKINGKSCPSFQEKAIISLGALSVLELTIWSLPSRRTTVQEVLLSQPQKDTDSAWTAALKIMISQIKVMALLLIVLITFFSIWGKNRLHDQTYQSKIVMSHHLIKIGGYPSLDQAMSHLSERVSGKILTFKYSPDITVWFGNLALFGIAFPDAKGIIKKDAGGYILFMED